MVERAKICRHIIAEINDLAQTHLKQLQQMKESTQTFVHDSKTAKKLAEFLEDDLAVRRIERVLVKMKIKSGELGEQCKCYVKTEIASQNQLAEKLGLNASSMRNSGTAAVV